MKSFWFISILFSLQNSQGQNIHWLSSDNWKLYDIHKSSSLQYSVDTLINFNFIRLNKDSLKYFLKEFEPLPKNQEGLWMGAFIASCEIKKQIRKIDISIYGGFIYDEFEKRYYQLPPELSSAWMNYLNRSFDTMPFK